MKVLLPLILLASPLHAAIVYSGQQNISVAWNDLEGVYVNIASGAVANAYPADFDAAPWVNITLGGYGVFNSELLKPVAVKAGDSYDPQLTTDYYLNLAPGTLLNASTGFTDGAFGSQFHVGTSGDPGKFVPGENGFMGFAFQEEAGGDTYYGWLRFIASNNAFGAFVDWSFNDVSGEQIEVGAVPEPTGAALVLAASGCLAGLCRRRPWVRR